VNNAYGNPLVIVPEYAMGTPERIGIIEAYRATQRLLTITGICICVPLIGFAAALRNPKLNNEQTLAKDSESESEADREEHAVDRA
jgi:SIT family siderophore-iron:H+ symporter-like MFS transporter